MLNLGNKLENKKILIYGFGKTGKSSYNFLKKNKIIIYDDNYRIIPRNIKKRNFLKLSKIKNQNFDYIVLSPGININNCKLKNFIIKNKKKIITDLDLFYWKHTNNLKITITGTNGKSTTSQLLYEILKKNNKNVRLVGNIGKPVLSEKSVNPKTIFIIEASSYQIEYSKYFKTNYSAILNVSPDHLERHGTFTKYVRAKFKLIKNQKKMGLAFIEKKNKHLINLIKKTKNLPKIIKVNYDNVKSIEKNIQNSNFKNKNNIQNLSFALEIANKLKLNKKKILKAINSFKALRYRQEIIYSSGKLLIINDSKSTSFSSSINLIKSFKNIYWLVGGLYKKGDRFNLKKENSKSIRAYIYGKYKNFFIRQFKNKLTFKSFNNVQEALKEIILDIKKEKLNSCRKEILFSPSAASFDSYNNFEERGKYFNYLVKKLKVIKIINDN
tara:strand:+ start:450 stop:1772 length:1323 start_codon:yes stop_codon:yes gene_type:complete